MLNSVKAAIMAVLPLGQGTLPVRYLGVPLISTSLSKDHCQPLIDRITARVKVWTVQFLSYAGRLQLVNSVLMSMNVY